ncbi:MAG: PqqD family protein [Lachnospiraceae bacterium]|nr:PqqD family protein [Lachnospiraceae bacterium]
MRMKKGFVLREVAGQFMVIATGEASRQFHGMIRLNQTGKEIWQGLSDGLTEEEIAGKLVQSYGIEKSQAAEDVRNMIRQMAEEGFLQNEEP